MSRQVSLIPSISQRSSLFLTYPHFLAIILPFLFVNLNLNLESAHSPQLSHVEGHISDNFWFEQRSSSSTHSQFTHSPWNRNSNGESLHSSSDGGGGGVVGSGTGGSSVGLEGAEVKDVGGVGFGALGVGAGDVGTVAGLAVGVS